MTSSCLYWGAVVSHSMRLALHASLFCGSMLDRPHLLTSSFTHSDHVFLGLHRPLVSAIAMFETNLIQDVTRCSCPYHLSRRLRRTGVTSSMPSFWSSEAEGDSSRSLVPQNSIDAKSTLGNGLVPSGNKPSPEPKSTLIYVTIWRH